MVSAANSDKPPSISTSSLPFNLSSSSLPIIGQGSAKKAPPLPPTSLDSSEQQDLKKLLKKKNHEIENLNQECLELEEQTTSLKAEVQEAWDNYKQAQERAAVREAELLDEIKEIQSAKATDKQQSVQQFTKMQEDITLLSQQLQAQQEEKLTLKQQIADYEQLNETWEEKIRILKDDLQEARMGTIQGVQALRDELRLSQTQQEQMRVDHHNIVRQLQLRQEEMEREHQELANAMHSKEREIQRLKNSSGTSGNSQNSSGNDGEGDHMALQTELINTAKKLQQSEEAYEELQRLHKQLDRESKALQLNYDDEKDVNRRLTDSIRSLQQQVATLQVSGSEVNASTNTAQTSAGESASMSDVSDLKNQIEHLSKMLLKKQANVLELQAERSALKSRVTDLQTR